MGTVHAEINGIIIHCNDSVLGINIGAGYTLEKRYLTDISYKNKITDGDGRLTLSYIGSQLKDDNGVYFICLNKVEDYSVTPPNIRPGICLTDRDIMCEDQIIAYKQNQMQYLHKIFSLIHLFKAGNIGFVQLFFEQKYTAMGFITNTMHQTDNSVTKNIVDERVFSLTTDEITACNAFLTDYIDTYDIIKDNIDEFIWGLEQVDVPTGFEQFTTALEMTMLAKGQRNKKEALAKRVSVLLETDPAKRLTLYNKMKDFYRYRSESLHEGNGQNITSSELLELEEVVRRILVKYLEYCKNEMLLKPTATWEEIKDKKINEMISVVQTAIAANELPQ